MKIRPIKVQNMNDQYLLALLRSENLINYNLAINEMKKRLNNKNITFLLYKWIQEENQTLKELFEIAIANKFSICFPVINYENLPDIVKKYLETVSSIEAITILLNINNQTIQSKSRKKYCEFLEDYLDITEERDFDLYKKEGDDSFIFEEKVKKVIPFPTEQVKFSSDIGEEKTKIYKLSKWNQEEKDD